jgi:hypothetical protein
MPGKMRKGTANMWNQLSSGENLSSRRTERNIQPTAQNGTIRLKNVIGVSGLQLRVWKHQTKIQSRSYESVSAGVKIPI